MIKSLGSCLEDTALDWYLAFLIPHLSTVQDPTWEQVRIIFQRAFIRGAQRDRLMAEILSAKQQRNERPLSFLYRVKRMCQDYDANMPEYDILRYIVGGLSETTCAAVASKLASSPTIENLRSTLEVYEDFSGDRLYGVKNNSQTNTDHRDQEQGK